MEACNPVILRQLVTVYIVWDWLCGVVSFPMALKASLSASILGDHSGSIWSSVLLWTVWAVCFCCSFYTGMFQLILFYFIFHCFSLNRGFFWAPPTTTTSVLVMHCKLTVTTPTVYCSPSQFNGCVTYDNATQIAYGSPLADSCTKHFHIIWQT